MKITCPHCGEELDHIHLVYKSVTYMLADIDKAGSFNGLMKIETNGLKLLDNLIELDYVECPYCGAILDDKFLKRYNIKVYNPKEKK